MTAAHSNRLIHETSPYLLQHAHNPVDWYPWGDEAFEKAKRENKPVLLSIGYATCHWCHVMEKESFEDQEIAKFMNEHYVSIKVDREQRPDLDAVYMASVQLMTGHGGWPMTVWLTPDRKPYYGGTYFPARDGDRGAQIGFLTLLKRRSEIFVKEPDRVAGQVGQIVEGIRVQTQAPFEKGELSEKILHEVFESFSHQFDTQYGGFGPAPKFPRPSVFRFLFAYGKKFKNDEATQMALKTLQR